MEPVIQILLALLTWAVLIVIYNSIIMPGPRQIMIIVAFKGLRNVICNINGKKIYKGEDDPKNHLEKWDLIDLEPGEKNRKLNIYFYLWPIWKVYNYEFTYPKLKKIGQEEEGDIKIWENKLTNECVVVRKGVSNHIEFRVEYPNITPSLDTKEMATVNTFTTNVIEAINPVKMMFGINNWLGLSFESLNGALRGLVASKSIYELNKLSSELKGEFNDTMVGANEDIDKHPGLKKFGVKIIKSIFKDFDPADDNAKRLMESYSKVQILENEGAAEKKKQEGLTEAYLLKTNAEITQEKKRRVQTGTAKVDSDGNITELVPEANIKVVADNIGKLQNLKGTLVMGSEVTNMLNIKSGGVQ